MSTPSLTTTAPAVELSGITKRFPGVVANDRVDLRVAEGEIHAVVGENGAGKSTLMKILYGMQAADEGTMTVGGAEVRFSSPSEAIDAGIGMVHQHFMLADQLTVLENVVLGAEPTRRGTIDRRSARRDLEELGRSYGLDLDPDDPVETLEVGERQRVEIIKVLYRGAKVLILDEPTAVLVPQEVEELFKNLRELKARGHTIIFIDHKLEEVLAIADAITVLRQGRTVATVEPSGVTAHQLAEMMVGSDLPTPSTEPRADDEYVTLAIRGLSVPATEGRPALEAVDLEVRRGEIVGVAGVEGNGQGVLVETILGLRQAADGNIALDGESIVDWTVRRRREAGLGYVPEDRQRRGLLLDAPLWENAMLGHQTAAPYTNGPWINRRGARDATTHIVADFDVRTPGIDTTARALSGGNQQKLVLGREMAAEPRMLIAAHPTRGIDVGAQASVWADLREARADGLAVLLVSADLEELIGLADRLLVMLRGRIVAELDPATTTPMQLGGYMTGASGEEGAS
ncbi:MAG: ABC transporter ATP-binding protein [Actinomycetota bacterium]|nr:ABC transporter ATP-binding protein [Actinomycetota bacterium]MEC9394288.1 ABC transporter ATP-binding protein [Actinomycetota bacterium]MEC9467430.1 ABC transporter ATP-binding protein [Actinomycetota bacterium]MED5220638.1 ABC transporter ATP-binding protein [Actinomycetota bacterium]MED6327871.1 ABC transporter ATP-binding protein [Actinomycetota bacterium]